MLPRGYGSVWKPGGTGTLLVSQCHRSDVADAISSAQRNFLRTYYVWDAVLLKGHTFNALKALVISKKSLYPGRSHLIWFHEITIPSSAISETKWPVNTEPQPWLQTLSLFPILDTFFVGMTRTQKIVFQKRNDVSGICHLRKIWMREIPFQREEGSTCLWEGGRTRLVCLGAWDSPGFSLLSWHTY